MFFIYNNYIKDTRLLKLNRLIVTLTISLSRGILQL